MLQAQKIYGAGANLTDCGELSLGRSLYATAPEDSNDRGPITRGPYTLVADIRIDNREELAGSLRLSSGEAAQLCDAAILFECLVAWNVRAFDRIAGEFAIAFWDDSKKRLLLARDFLGLRPLFYHRRANFFAFSSMPSGLHALADVPYDFDPEYLAESLAMMPEVGTRTRFKSIERVEPAHFVEITRGRLTSTRYWTPQRPSGRPRRPKDYEEGLRSVVDEAVRAQMRGAGPIVAAHLSGGLDSSIVVTSTARQFPETKVLACTAVPRRGFEGPVPPNGIASEAGRAAGTAARYPNIEHVIVENGETSPLAGFDRAFAYQQQPLLNICNEVWATSINRLARDRGARVLLMGTTGNLSVSYYGFQWMPELLRQGRLIKLAQIALATGRNGYPWLSIGAQIIGPYLPMPLWKLLSRRVTDLRQYAPVNMARIDEIDRKARERAIDFSYRPRADSFETRTWVLGRFDSASYVKGMLGEFGLSMRDPTADKRVVEFCLSVPPEEYIRDGVPRSLARRAFGDRIPPEVTNATVRGYQAADWYEGLENDLVSIREELARISKCDQARSALDVEWLEQAVASWPTEGWERDDVIMRYRHGLQHGLSVGYFMRKVAGTN
jgi:asparagine synthase (glutamine-hydrolysing)